MFERMARNFLTRCYLAGPGTHERIISEMAKALRGEAWAFFILGFAVGGFGVWLLAVLMMGG